MAKINVFIPHRWNNSDYDEISDLLSRTKYNVETILYQPVVLLTALTDVIMSTLKFRSKFNMPL